MGVGLPTLGETPWAVSVVRAVCQVGRLSNPENVEENRALRIAPDPVRSI